ncbi:hypothetical protein RG47T_0756 [Mucilaginibacter polytrichastri]|uniref:Metalloprotease n=2 Tax=Mucilaginibacter polytrichastri TaxID=1302689 RepID=A0A1Q5ZU64_9SPHI|nr:hypothetical protein RG47T_0756 [Mucilaginibacter polytrichastri]
MGILCIMHTKAQHSGGCISQETSPISKQIHVAKGTGNPQMDRWLDREATILRGFFGVNPGLLLYNDSLVNNPGGYASSVSESATYPDGTIALGYNYLQNMYNYSGNFTMIPVVAAHEFAHIVDCTLKVTPAIPIYKELYADYMAGSFIAYSTNQSWIDISRNFRWIVRIGDYAAINDPDCHGTSLQRMAAFKSGYDWFKSQAQAGNKVLGKDASGAARGYLNLPEEKMVSNK